MNLCVYDSEEGEYGVGAGVNDAVLSGIMRDSTLKRRDPNTPDTLGCTGKT